VIVTATLLLLIVIIGKLLCEKKLPDTLVCYFPLHHSKTDARKLFRRTWAAWNTLVALVGCIQGKSAFIK